MLYQNVNTGLLQVEDVKAGDKLKLIDDAYSTFSEKNQRTYWNVKVQLPDGSHKIAGIMDSSGEAFAKKWGDETSKWTGHTVVVEIKTSKAGNPYIVLVPEGSEAAPVKYPETEITPDDIPF